MMSLDVTNLMGIRSNKDGELWSEEIQDGGNICEFSKMEGDHDELGCDKSDGNKIHCVEAPYLEVAILIW